MNYLVYDIETVTNPKARDYFANKQYAAPSTWKDKTKIDQYVMEQRHKDTAKAALSWWTGMIVCISVEPFDKSWAPKTFVGPDEKKIIALFFDVLTAEQKAARWPILVGKSSEYFDRPYLIGRAMAHNLGVPDCMRDSRQLRDIDQIFGYGSRADQASNLNDYAVGLGLEKKKGHGTDVAGWYNAAISDGDKAAWNKIGTYCAHDNTIAGEVLRRYLKTYVPGEQKPTMSETVRAMPFVDIKGKEVPVSEARIKAALTANALGADEHVELLKTGETNDDRIDLSKVFPGGPSQEAPLPPVAAVQQQAPAPMTMEFE